MDNTKAKQPKPKQNTQTPKNDNMIEQFRGVGRNVGKSVVKDVAQGISRDALSSLFGSPNTARSGDMQAGKPISLGKNPLSRGRFSPERFPRSPFKKEKKEWKPLVSQETMNRLRAQENEVQKRIEEVRVEIKQLINELKGVDREIVRTVEQPFVNPGEYHISFLDRLKAVLNIMLKEMKDSRSWLAVMQSRKKQRTFWSLYKKKGTKFGLSSEHTVTRQVG